MNKCFFSEEAEKLRAAGAKYGQNSEQPSAKKKKSEDIPVKYIKFGTNIDISDSNVFGKQLRVGFYTHHILYVNSMDICPLM